MSELPQKVTDLIGEFSYGGYMLFYIDERGLPRCSAKFGEPMDAIGLQKFALDFTKALDKAGRKSLKLFLKSAEVGDDDEDGE